jgi:hypothetical protein
VSDHRKRRRALRVPESIDDVIARGGEDRFAPARPPFSERVWKDAVGVRIAERAKPVLLVRGVLVVRAATSVWATELSLLSSSLIERLRSQGLEVTELRFRVGAIEPPARPPERRLSQAVPAPAPLPPLLSASIAKVDDGELQVSIARAARANLAWQKHTRPEPVIEGPPGARAPQSVEKGTGRRDPASEASGEGRRCTPGDEPHRPT